MTGASANTQHPCGQCGCLWIFLQAVNTVIITGKGGLLGLLGAVVWMSPAACKQQRLCLELQLLSHSVLPAGFMFRLIASSLHSVSA